MKSLGSKFILSCATLWLGGCGNSGPNDVVYEDVTELSGLQFVHVNGSDDTLALPPIMGSGVALFDVDGDADLDVYLVQGAGDPAIPDELWLNQSDGDRMRFERMPNQPAFASSNPGMGVAVEDVDLDGRLDVLVTHRGPNRLLLNQADGFVEAESALAEDDVWSASAVWLDANADGLSDVFISNVAEYNSDLNCWSLTRRPDYCGADQYPSRHDQLLLNEGIDDAGTVTFRDVSHEWGIAGVSAPSLGVRAADFNGDGFPDLYVAVGGLDNALWINRGGNDYVERSLSAGGASSFMRSFQGSAGVDVADFDRDGDLDIVSSHRLGEPHQLYLNDSEGRFIANTITAGGLSEAQTGVGLVVLDANADGHDDLYVANGALQLRQSQLDSGDAQPLRETNALLVRNDQERIHFDLWNQSSERLTPRAHVSRSVVAGDLDNDGDVDLVVTNNGAAAQVLRNVVNPDHWLGIAAVKSNGLADVGARVWLRPADSSSAQSVSGVREIRRAHGYLGSSDPRLLIYPATTQTTGWNVEVLWSGGIREQFIVPQESRYHTVAKGSGQLVERNAALSVPQ